MSGYNNVRTVGQSGDRGVDILCADSFGQRVVVQCKRYSPDKKVSSGEMQSFVGAIFIAGGDAGLFVTKSSFTKEAASIAGGYDVVLIDGVTLVEMAKQRPPVPAPDPSWLSHTGRFLPSPPPPPIVTTFTVHGWTGREVRSLPYEAD